MFTVKTKGVVRRFDSFKEAAAYYDSLSEAQARRSSFCREGANFKVLSYVGCFAYTRVE